MGKKVSEAKAKTQSFADTLYIELVEDDVEDYYVPHRDISELDHGDTVGIYKLTDIRTAKRTTELE